ncbi:gamma-glutamylcyclotransferase family protein [Bacillus suaedaesalsae]|uniref:Gamma-glutamylcyclotransferase family protein n=1 Tax=Bacillus suaedaesalsae TaxID=2810349 RepID=A0ABS2DMK0_9BACI|nr:gamma-glutamylcyclotransferase family protein [Bacillus suaedaesalsae]MBM6619636.1 gamma-glutamylcyclotransferase [Bacillus suaedaesalsae]
MERTINVFVYGTLRKGERNHHFLKDAVFVSEDCWTDGIMIDTGKGYPALLPTDTKKVVGELYKVNLLELTKLDYLEGYVEGKSNNLYERITQTIYINSEEIKGFVYIMNDNRNGKVAISSGNWKNRASNSL